MVKARTSVTHTLKVRQCSDSIVRAWTLNISAVYSAKLGQVEVRTGLGRWGFRKSYINTFKITRVRLHGYVS